MVWKISETCQIPVLYEFYARYFSKSDGYFVEVGAYDGESWSNTSALADIGWQGLYIEPIAEYLDLCRARHSNNNVEFENVAVGFENTKSIIHVSQALSTLDLDTHRAHEKIFRLGVDSETRTVQTQRLEDILGRHSVPKAFDLLVVDVEGNEWEVFQSFSFDEYHPTMLIVELCDVHASYNHYPDLQNRARQTRQHILEHGYKEVYVDAINTIFVRSEIE
jgi:FkbM family methyltransferase